MAEENCSDPIYYELDHPDICSEYDYDHEEDGDIDKDMTDIKTPLIFDDGNKTPCSGYKDIFFQFPSATPRSILKSTNHNLVSRAVKTKMRTFLTVPGTSLSSHNDRDSSSKCPASTPLPLSTLGK